MKRFLRDRSPLDFTFRVAVVLKGLYGVGEVIVGVLLAVAGSAAVTSWVTSITAPTLAVHPHEFLATLLVNSVASLTGGLALFLAIYLMVHGMVKIVLLWAVATQHPRVYPWMIHLLSGFVLYQVVKILIAFSLPLLLLTLVDLFIIVLTVREWRMTEADKARYEASDGHGGEVRRKDIEQALSSGLASRNEKVTHGALDHQADNEHSGPRAVR